MNIRDIEYRRDATLDLDRFIALFRDSTLAERRPVDDREVMRQMMENASLTITAWDGDALVGIARTLTDFAHAAYLADLALHARAAVGAGRECVLPEDRIHPQSARLGARRGGARALIH